MFREEIGKIFSGGSRFDVCGSGLLKIQSIIAFRAHHKVLFSFEICSSGNESCDSNHLLFVLLRSCSLSLVRIHFKVVGQHLLVTVAGNFSVKFRHFLDDGTAVRNCRTICC